MKKYLSGTLVVEGKEDASYLSNYIASEIVVVNGYELDKTTISYLKNKKVIALLDPDAAGDKIREKINKLLPNASNVYIDINKCNRGKKTGVAECDINEILMVLKPYFIDSPCFKAEISQSTLFELGLMNDKDKRQFVCQELNLGNCNVKQLRKRLISNNIKLEQLYEIIEKYNNGNK